MIKLPDVTLLSYASIRIPEHIQAMEICCQKVEFGEVVFASDQKPDNLPGYIRYMPCKKIENIMDYNRMTFLNLGQYVNTSHALLVQDHAYILHEDVFDTDWLRYDYVGSIWPIRANSYVANNGEVVRNGNGGFSLRSKKLLDLAKNNGWELLQEQGYYNEDGNTVCYRRKEFLEQGIKYAPVEVSAKFGFETPVVENEYGNMKTFGFHRNLPPYLIHNPFNSVSYLGQK